MTESLFGRAGRPTPVAMPRHATGRRRSGALDARPLACRSRRRGPSPHRPGRTALLVDLENILYERGRRAPREVGAARIDAIFDVAGHADHVLVAGRLWALETHLGAFAARHVPVAVVSPAPDAADRLLGERFEFLAGRGFERFYLASRDGYFAAFAARRDTVVLSPNLRTVSGDLHRAATGVIVLDERRPADARAVRRP
ncbi:hypothetical protein BS35_006546 [Actinomadura glauciflava]|uniref:hypothetical protein n=1 Tax=Actinomadura luteofluorescens TaxID=46163 RepID=UPI002164AF6F|nr:hypothetical protein [Actinomadura glauciflava]MCR3743965.1 hypothetical protein [Actinomadura glauciflava]